MSIELISIILLGLLVVFLVTGVPIAFALGAAGFIAAIIGWGFTSLSLSISNLISTASSFILIAVPLFAFMGALLERTGLGEYLFDMMYKWLGGIKGGLAIAVVVVCTLIGAMSGIGSTGLIISGLVAIPAMLKRNYNAELAVGVSQAAGPLGSIIPPSVMLVIYGSAVELSVGALFIGAVIPGLIMSALMIIYVAVVCYIKPEMGPAIPKHERPTWGERFKSLGPGIPPFLIIIAVLGGIFIGLCTPTEAAAVGSFAVVLMSIAYRKFSVKALKEASITCLKLANMVLWIMIGAASFSALYRGMGATTMIVGLVTESGFSPMGINILMLFILFILGMFIDQTAIIMIAAPFFAPIATALGFDALWFGILFAMVLIIGYISPPFGYSIYIMRGLVSKDVISTDRLMKSCLPYVAVLSFSVVIVFLFPQLATWLPDLLMGK